MKRILGASGKVHWANRACALLVLCATTAVALSAQTFTTLYSFDYTHGSYPLAGLIQATNGDLYGTASGGGTNGLGTVFKITPRGTLTTLINFGPECCAGAFPYAGLIQAPSGDLYGTTYGGNVGVGPGFSDGTVFKTTPNGAWTVLDFFCYSAVHCADGANPYAGLVRASNGDFYGTTYYGGGAPAASTALGRSSRSPPVAR